ncbi:MAG: hypothetical protein JWO47_171 [Candidatus Saccharibacteria bacterium]|nr:hypothetical protein [Candidatus Saccharibacteria bacterium]
MINANYLNRLTELKLEYEKLKKGKDSLLKILNDVELPELVYNSNAIENSTLTLKETERILLEQSVMREVSVRELFEAKNLARVLEYLAKKPNEPITTGLVLLLHQMLIGGIKDEIAGRFRRKNEYVQVGGHIAPAPEHVEALVEAAIEEFYGNERLNTIEKVARFHLEFERIHPFVDGNGRIGRVLMYLQLIAGGFPQIVVRNKGKRELYYPAFPAYEEKGDVKIMEKVVLLAVFESLHRRLAYLRGAKIVLLSDYAKRNQKSINTLLNAARRQTIPAFREKSTWKIGI